MTAKEKLLDTFECHIRNERFKLRDIQSALSAIENGDNPDEFARGQAAAYDDVFTRLTRLLDSLEIAREALDDE